MSHKQRLQLLERAASSTAWKLWILFPLAAVGVPFTRNLHSRLQQRLDEIQFEWDEEMRDAAGMNGVITIDPSGYDGWLGDDQQWRA